MLDRQQMLTDVRADIVKHEDEITKLQELEQTLVLQLQGEGPKAPTKRGRRKGTRAARGSASRLLQRQTRTPRAGTKKTMSAEQRQRRSDAQRARWDRVRAAQNTGQQGGQGSNEGSASNTAA
jgi:hypothetical protein